MKIIEPISFRLLHLGKLYLHVLAKRLGHLDINQYHYTLALVHYNNGKLTQKALANILGKDKSSMVNIIDSLTEKGYVYREINTVDRREHLIKLTPKAELEIPEIIDAFEDINKDIANQLSTDDIENFYRVLQIMENNIKPFSAQDITLDTKPTEQIKI